MDNVQAKAIMALATAYFPVPALSPSTETAWADALLVLDHAAALTAVRDLGRHGMPHGRPFHISELVMRTEAVQREANQARINYDGGRDALVDIVPASEEEKRMILATYWERVGVDREALARVTHAARNGGDKIEAARVLARRQIEQAASPFAEGQEQPIRVMDPPQALRSACGTPAGTEGVRNAEGVWVCPTCASPIAKGCAPRRVEEVS